MSAPLAILSAQERRNVERLFEHLFFFDQFAYPLFGSKPMSIGRLLEKKDFLDGWQSWEKIAPYYPSSKFVIQKYWHKNKPFLLIANMDQVEKTYTENQDIFDELFDGRITLDVLQQSIRCPDAFFDEWIQNDVALGILLGYGRQNAKLFAAHQTRSASPLRAFSSGHPLMFYFSKIMPPCFACDPHTAETMALKQQYSQERQSIIQMIKRDSLFLQMLCQLRSSPGKQRRDEREHCANEQR